MKSVQLLLTENVEGLGIVGDVVKVRSGYARNYLIPRGFVTQPSEEAIAALAERRKEVEAEMARIRTEREATLEKLVDFELTMQRAANDQGILFGGVSQHDIGEALREEGFNIEDRAIRIGVQIKRLDSYMIPIQLAQDLKTEIKVWVVSDRPLDLDEELEAAQHHDGEESEAAENPEAAETPAEEETAAAE